MPLPENPNIFANNPLDRASYRRTDQAWLSEQLAAPTSLFVPFRRQPKRDWEPFVLPEAAPSQGKDIGWLPGSLMPQLAGEGIVVFLGINKRGKALFAADVSALKDAENHPALKGLGSFEDLRGLAMAGEITPTELAIMAQAKSMIDWHSRHGFCSVCGTKSEMAEAGYKRQCPSCKAEHFPRTDPVVIMLATFEDKCFLGRQKIWPKGMHSALAGFVEPGESIEEAVARELHEEAGLSVGAVTYHSTQPWPYPSSLMIGCHAIADSEDFTIDGIELSEGRWFTRAEAQAILAGKGDGTAWFPPPFAIAHQLIKAFAEGK
ncbi:NUDIX hydrolase [Parvibaculum lavamentivorans DS-1]|uniref:NAD(+) diphosphatase n=1 Tax=Parvibaculum lavamentivorans (strain DS-1 / DSM 13023 / NCIMB 13966) TaxID=402881 RepID=A7HPP4_PARL1|nr:NAD(+) diphosphatase [Parvibaculum lavamentivorans]ABS61877.1 NUDIX hydrolase [Parvibaculum lavamentivorans DS-1]